MHRRWRADLAAAVPAVLLAVALVINGHGQNQAQPTAQSQGVQISQAVGTVKTVQGDSISLTADSGGEITVSVGASAKILRVSPGQTNLKNATPLQVQDLQPGDRVLVRGKPLAQEHSIAALAVIVMKRADVSAKQEQDLEDWERRGVGGLVSAVDQAGATVTITIGGFGETHNLLIRTTNSTIIRRYASDSIRFDDSRPALLSQVKPGDQLRARGAVSSGGTELTAEEIVFGTFRNIAGTISAIDARNNLLTVQDAITKSAVVVKILPDSQLKKLPDLMAQRIAMRLRMSGAPGGSGVNHGAGFEHREAGAAPGTNGPPSARGSFGGHGNGAPDMQRFLSRLPDSALADLQKGDAVMIVSTVGEGSGPVKAITLLSGVEPILTAAPNRNARAMLSPWTLGAADAEGESGP
jgi:hypothetical protein